ncbi:junctional sarcoplasmic reticulum protein 1 [Tenrec ecaudatus]|uniref:junctional sarcoplasmic reticulum protein 1 n=1 Tax=Tenrec ecaudatus TaxID=94439 RepID=UPI003F59DCD9
MAPPPPPAFIDAALWPRPHATGSAPADGGWGRRASRKGARAPGPAASDWRRAGRRGRDRVLDWSSRWESCLESRHATGPTEGGASAPPRTRRARACPAPTARPGKRGRRAETRFSPEPVAGGGSEAKGSPNSEGSGAPAPRGTNLVSPDAASRDFAMTTKSAEDLDGGLGSCQVGENLSARADPYSGQAREDTAGATPWAADLSSRPRDSAAAERGAEAKPKKMEKEPEVKAVQSGSKEKLKVGATPRSAPARKKAQAVPPAQPPPPPPPPAAGEELPWGDMTLNKCLVLASLLALLGSAFQLCRDAVTGKVALPAPAPEPWVPPGAAPDPKASEPPQPVAWAPPPAGPPAPQLEVEARPEAPGSGAAAEEEDEEEEAGEPAGEATEEAPEDAQVHRGPKEKRRKEKRPRRERPRREERPRADRELRGAPPGRRESRPGGHQPWTRDSGQRPTWASKKGSTSSEEAGRPPRRRPRPGKGRDRAGHAP